MQKALILVDIQNDFVPGGALAVPEGDKVVPVANSVMEKFDLIVATQDWHPPDHGSFASNHPGKKPGEIVLLDGLQQILWPDHCIQGSLGAEFVAGLDQSQIDHVVQKGMDSNIDSYSGFFDNDHRKVTGLDEYLRQKRVGALTIMGLATDYCVKFTALDARMLGYPTKLLRDGVRGVEICRGDCVKALTAMQSSGVEIIGVADL